MGSRYPVYKIESGKNLFSKIGRPIEGSISYFTRTLVGVKTNTTKRYKKSTLSAFVFDSSPIPKTELSIFTSSREVYCGKPAGFEGSTVVIENLLGKVKIPLKRIVRYKLSSSKCIDLQEKMIKSTSLTPYFDSVRKPQFNKSFTGSDIRLNGLPLGPFLQ